MDEAEKDLFENLPEAFIDHNEDGEYTPDLDSCKGGGDSPQCIAGQEEIFFESISGINATFATNLVRTADWKWPEG